MRNEGLALTAFFADYSATHPPVSGQTTVRLINHAISELKEFPI
jgi:hypothetical protein